MNMERLRVGMVQHEHLPSELLSKIFTHCLGTDPAPVPLSSPQSMPWVLGHVCSRWRQVSLNERRLWDYVAPHTNGTFPLIAFEEVLRRSGSRTVRMGPISSETLQLISPTLQRLHNKFTSLDIEVTRDIAEFLTELVCFERLEHLSVHYDFVIHDIFEDDISELSAPPGLRTLTLTNRNNISAIPFNETGIDATCSLWSHLTELEIHALIATPPRTMFHILQHSTVLIHLKIYLSDGFEYYDPNNFNVPIVVPSLRSLRLRIDEEDPSIPGRVFALLNLPSLAVLELQGGETEMWPQQELLSFFDRSGCRLEEFCTMNYAIPLDSVVPIMRALPTLVNFSIDTARPLPDSDLQTIISDNLLPSLKHLTAWVVSGHAVLELLNSRWSDGAGVGIWSGKIHLAVPAGDDGLEALLSAVTQKNTAIEIITC